jgi:hypothetical protein
VVQVLPWADVLAGGLVPVFPEHAFGRRSGAALRHLRYRHHRAGGAVGLHVRPAGAADHADRLGGGGVSGALLLALGGSFEVFAAGQILLGAGAAFASGTDSALLYESLAAAGRKGEVERQELRAWRFSFGALAASAVTGGLLAQQGGALTFLAGAAALAGALVLAWSFSEPPKADSGIAQGGELVRLGSLRAALTEPVLMWLFALSLLMYVLSHVPFVFGQPFILEALKGTGLEAGAPMASGAVTTVMMVLSIAVSLLAPGLRRRLGLPGILLLAFAMQVALIAVMALSDAAIVIAFLFLRMVPDSLSKPFILARIQPQLSDASRATYMSLQSFCGRMVFAGTLFAASFWTSGEGQMPYSEIQQVLGWYLAGGLLCLGALTLAARRVRIDPAARDEH